MGLSVPVCVRWPLRPPGFRSYSCKTLFAQLAHVSVLVVVPGHRAFLGIDMAAVEGGVDGVAHQDGHASASDHNDDHSPLAYLAAHFCGGV